MAEKNVTPDVSLVLDEIMTCLGDAAGPFSLARARTLEADETLETFGLGPSTLGFGKNRRDGHPKKVNALVDAAEMGDPAAFDAAMRYAGLRMVAGKTLPRRLGYLAARVLTESIERPVRRKATSKGLSLRDLGVFIAVELLVDLGAKSHTLAYRLVAAELLRRKLSPNSAKSVKRIHLAVRNLDASSFTLHHIAFIGSLFVLPSAVFKMPIDLAFDRWGVIRGHDT